MADEKRNYNSYKGGNVLGDREKQIMEGVRKEMAFKNSCKEKPYKKG